MTITFYSEYNLLTFERNNFFKWFNNFPVENVRTANNATRLFNISRCSFRSYMNSHDSIIIMIITDTDDNPWFMTGRKNYLGFAKLYTWLTARSVGKSINFPYLLIVSMCVNKVIQFRAPQTVPGRFFWIYCGAIFLLNTK